MTAPTPRRLPAPGEVWDQKQTAAMCRAGVTRAVEVVSVDSRWVHVQPAQGERGRRASIEIPAFVRKFTRREG